MGYFSALLLVRRATDERDHYPSAERQWLWRLEDLMDRRQELMAHGAPYRTGRRYTDEEWRYAPAQELVCVDHVEKAIRAAQKALFAQCGAVLMPPQTLTGIQEDRFDPDQITIPEYRQPNIPLAA